MKTLDVETLEDGRVLVAGEPLESLQEPREGEPAESAAFAGRLQAAAEVVRGVAEMRRAQLKVGPRPAPLNDHLRELAQQCQLPWERLAAYYQIPSAGSISGDSIRGWSALARDVRLSKEDAGTQLLCAVMQQQGFQVGALMGAAFGGGAGDKRRAQEEMVRQLNETQNTELERLQAELESVYTPADL